MQRSGFAAMALLAVLMTASSLGAVPIVMEYSVSGTGPYTYNFRLILDNNDNSWVPAANQGWSWVIFGDQNSAPSPLTNYTHTSGFPVGPFTSVGGSGGGHNGPTFHPLAPVYWAPTALNEQLQWSGTSTADLQQGQMLWSTLQVANGAVAANFAVGQRILSTINVNATAGAPLLVAPNEQGPGGNGFVAGTFILTNESSTNAGTATGIQIQGGGSGTHGGAYAPFALYRESGIGPGFDIATDIAIGTGVFTGSPERVNFTFSGAEQTFGPAQIKQYYLVARLSGTPAPGQTFNYRVSSLSTAPGTSRSGVPSAIMSGFNVDGPILTASAILGAPVNALASETGPGGNGFAAAAFTIAGNAQGATNLNSISLTASGTGNDQTTYTQVAIYVDSDANNTWQFGTDALYGAAAPTFPVDNGTLTFAQPLAFAASESKRFFIVVKLAGSPPALNLQTFNFSVSGMTAAASQGTLGTPTPAMSGVTITGPQLTVSATAGAAQNVLTTETGPGGNGRLAASFTIANNAVGAGSLTSVSIQASGTGNDQAAFSQVALYEDTNSNQTFEFGTDTLYGSVPSFPADNGTAIFTANLPYAASQSRRFLVVCKFGSATPTTNGQTFNFAVSAITAGLGVNTSGTPTLTMNGFVIQGPVLAAGATGGTALQVFANATGPGGNGFAAGVFTVANTTATNGSLTSITLTASGTGNDLNAYSSVQLFEDSNNNSTWDGPDAQVGATLPSFSADNGTAQFAPAGGHSFTGTQSRRYFVVVKLNGPVLAPVASTFNFVVSALAVSSNALASGLPSALMNGLIVIPPVFNVVDNPLPVVTVYRGTTDVLLQKFVISYPAGPNNAINVVNIKANGTGNDAADISGARLFRDANDNGTLEIGTDSQVASAPGFPGDNGTVSFGLSAPDSTFVAGQSKTFFYVADFGNSGLNMATFQTRVENCITGYAGSTFSGIPSPAAYTTGAVMELPLFVFAENSPAVMQNAFLGDPGFTLQAFTVSYPIGPANSLGSITLSASGTGDDQAAYAAVHLYLDDPVAGSPGSFDSMDTLVDTQPAFNADNGQLSFNLTGLPSQFTAAQVRQFLVVADFNQLGANNTTFSSTVTGIAGAGFGALPAGLPAGPSAGLRLLDANVRVSLNGPGAATSVNSNSQGINDEGLLVCDITVATGPGSAWLINTLVFVATGTANHATAYADLWLYEDDGNGAWNGPLVDTPAAAPATGFAAATGEASFNLLNSDTLINTSRRFYLLGRLAGTATTGQTLNARLDSVVGVPAVGGSVRGAPTASSTALIIDQTALTVLSGPGTPVDLLRKTGTALNHAILNVRLAATNDDIDVDSIQFSNSGTGNFAASLSANGFQVYLDDGDGTFSAADALLFQSGGNATISAVFGAPVTVPNSESRDLWVIFDFLATAGAGAAVPLTYQSVINTASAVSASAGAVVLLGTPAPQSNVVRIVDFFVTTFDALADLPSGGRDITITGSGFMAPIIVMIDGSVCPGTAVINAGTQVTGIQVPPGTGFDVPITIKSGGLATETLTQTFDYVPLAPPKAPSSSGCSAAGGLSAWWLGAAALPLAARIRRRK